MADWNGVLNNCSHKKLSTMRCKVDTNKKPRFLSGALQEDMGQSLASQRVFHKHHEDKVVAVKIHMRIHGPFFTRCSKKWQDFYFREKR